MSWFTYHLAMINLTKVAESLLEILLAHVDRHIVSINDKLAVHTEALVWRCSVKKVQAQACNFIKKRASGTGVFL